MSPEESVASGFSSNACSRVFRQTGHTDDFASIVRALREIQDTSEITEVNHLAILPKKWVLGWYPGCLIWYKAGVGGSDNDSRLLIIATRPRETVWTAEGADVLEFTSFPDKSSHFNSYAKQGKGIGNSIV